MSLQQLPSDAHSETGLHRSLKERHMRMIAVGGVIGAGLFVGSGVGVQATGPAAVFSFALTGLLVVLVMRMLGEMASAFPAVGGFYEYNRLALGEFAGFMTGWMYWYFWIIVVAFEAVAGSKLLVGWFGSVWPTVQPWQYTLGLTSLFTVVNLLSVRAWGEAEYWFASIKVAAIAIFLLVGVTVVLGLWHGVPGGFHLLTDNGGFLPKGLGPVLTGAVAATGFYFGSEIVTVAAAESAEPERAIARATQSVVSRVLVFYVGSIFLVVCIVPWNTAGMATPYVSVLDALHIPYAGTAMGIVILTAVLSCLNSGVFASSRMMMALARRGDAPRLFAKLDSRGVPIAAIFASMTFAFVAVFMNYLSPDKVFKFLVDSYGTVALFVYVLIAFAELGLRRRMDRECPERLRVRMWCFPWLTLIAIAMMFSILGAMAFIADQQKPLLFGVISALVMALGYLAFRRGRSSRP